MELRSPDARRHAEQAHRLLLHYLAAGRSDPDYPDLDTRTETREIVDHIIRAAIEEASLGIATVAGLAVNAHVCAYHEHEI